MLQARDAHTGLLVSGLHAQREGRYECPECGALVGLRCGPRKAPHFAHFSTAECSLSEPESPRHRALKFLCHDLFAPLPVAWEVPLGPCRADVLVDGSFTVECQASPMSIQEWQARTAHHNCCGFPVLWLWDVKRLCRRNTLEEARTLERIQRPIWAPPEIRHCHQESGGLVFVADKHGVMACRLQTMTPGELRLAKRHGAAWHETAFFANSLRKMMFSAAVDPRVHRRVVGESGQTQLLHLESEASKIMA